jgi:SAM-dependent methyltransferase
VGSEVDRHDRGVARDEAYLLDNQHAQAGRRFDALSVLFNPSTFQYARALGLAPGWRVWEVGAGTSSVPAWLAKQVGPDGRVLATDIDTSWIDGGDIRDIGYEVRRHDVGAQPPPQEHFDLVHARLVLVHVPQRAQALAAMVAAVRPGGWLLLEEADPALQPLVCPDESGSKQRLANKLKHGFRTLLAEHASIWPTGEHCRGGCAAPASSTCSPPPTSQWESRPVPNSSVPPSSRSAIVSLRRR